MSEKGVWCIRERNGEVTTRPVDPEAVVHVPQNLPTYRRLNCIHSGDPLMETRLRAASLGDACAHMNETAPCRKLMDDIHRTGEVSAQQAEALRQYAARPNLSAYLQEETMLLLEAGGHVEADAPNPQRGDDRT